MGTFSIRMEMMSSEGITIKKECMWKGKTVSRRTTHKDTSDIKRSFRMWRVVSSMRLDSMSSLINRSTTQLGTTSIRTGLI